MGMPDECGDKWGFLGDNPPGLGICAVFMGEFEHTVEENGRMAVPAKFRPAFAEGLVVTRGLDRCLFVFTRGDWERLAERLSQLPLTSAEARSFVRLMFAGATDGELDGQGRVVLPAYLREYADIRQQAVVIGVNTRVEIWSREAWRTARSQVEEQADFIAGNLASLGII